MNSLMAERWLVKPGVESSNLSSSADKKGGVMFWKLFKRNIKEVVGLFNGYFIEVKALYALKFDAVSCVSFIGEIDTSKAFALIDETLKLETVSIYQHSYFDHNEQKMFFNSTIFVLSNKRMIELGNNWCQILHTPYQHNWANELIKQLSQYKEANKEPAIGFARQAVAN